MNTQTALNSIAKDGKRADVDTETVDRLISAGLVLRLAYNGNALILSNDGRRSLEVN